MGNDKTTKIGNPYSFSSLICSLALVDMDVISQLWMFRASHVSQHLIVRISQFIDIGMFTLPYAFIRFLRLLLVARSASFPLTLLAALHTLAHTIIPSLVSRIGRSLLKM